MEQVRKSYILAEALKRCGVTHVLSVPGGPVIRVLAYCGQLGMRVMGVRHEQAAVMTAQAYNYVSGKPGAVSILASGPAVTNALTGIHTAWDNAWPVVVLGGSSALKQRWWGDFQEADSVALARPITKWAAQVHNPERIPEFLHRAFAVATSGRPGPVYLDLPHDVLAGTLDAASVRWVNHGAPFPPSRALVDATGVEKAAAVLMQAERPVVIIGKGARWSEPYAELRSLVDLMGLPFLPSPMGRGFIPDDHPLCFSGARTYALRNADVVVVVGARLNWMFAFGELFQREAKIIQIDVDPAESAAHHRVDIPVIGDVKAVLALMVDMLRSRGADARYQKTQAWRDDLARSQEENRHLVEKLVGSDDVPINPYRMLGDVRAMAPRESIICVDGERIMACARQVLQSYEPVTRLNAGSNGCMGVGIPFAIGAKLAAPTRPVISINGDCAFGFNGMEMETALRYKLPIVFIISNNGGISGALVQDEMFPHGYPEPVATYLPGIRYDKIIEAFGGNAWNVEHPKDLRPALQAALKAKKASCINVVIDPRASYASASGQSRPPGILAAYGES